MKKAQLLREPFSNFDAFLLHIETPTNLMVITGLIFLDLPINTGALKRVVEERLLKFERFQQRVVKTGLLVKTPKWEYDPLFDIDAHIHTAGLPAPGDESALKGMVDDLMAVPLDMNKPPWQLFLVEKYGEGSVVVARFHHTLADGLSLVNVFNSLEDEATSSSDGSSPKSPRHKATSLVGKLAVPPLKLTSKLLGASKWVLQQGLGMVDNPDYIKDSVTGATGAALTLSKYVVGKSDPHTSLRGQCGIAKKSTWSAPISLQQVKALGKQLGGTVNDVMLAAVAGGLRRYLQGNAETIDFQDIRAVVPVNVRAEGDFANLGNQVGMVLMPLPVGEENPLERFQIVKMRMDELKGSGEPDLIFNMLNIPVFKSRLLDTTVVGSMTTKASLLVTNVPGPKGQIGFAGRKIRQAVFWVPQPAGWGLGISILSYAGEITLGVAVDASLIRDPEQILDGIEAEFGAMQEWAAKPAAE